MDYQIIWSESAQKQLKKLDRAVAKQIYKKVGELTDNPFRNVKKLVGGQGFRLRVGDYRVIFDIEGDKLRIIILKVGHRSNIYG